MNNKPADVIYVDFFAKIAIFFYLNEKQSCFCSLMNKKGRRNTQNTPLVKPNISVLEDLSKKICFTPKL